MTLYEKLRTRKIALVDPDPWIRDSLSLFFQCEVCRLLTFASVADGIRAVETGRFDIIICDYGLPGMDGVTFLKNAARIQPDSIRILIAGYPVGELAEIAAREGIHACLQKPFTIDALERTLEPLVANLRTGADRAVEATVG